MSLPAHLAALGNDLDPAAARAVARERRAHQLRVAAVAVAVAGVFAGAALAATRLLGEPAPPSVQSNVRAMAAWFVDQPGLKAQTARVVAEAPDAVLYGVYDERGSYCVELVGATRGLIFGSTCDLGFGVPSKSGMVGSVSLPQANMIVDGVAPPVVVYGKLADGAVAADALLGDGSRDPVTVGLGGFYVYEPPEAKQAVARRLPISVAERDASGREIWQAYFQPPLALAVEGGRVSGRVEITGTAKLVVGQMPGTIPRPQPVPLGSDGSFTWTPPASWPGLGDWSVLDKNGRPLATAAPLPEQAWRQILDQAKNHQ